MGEYGTRWTLSVEQHHVIEEHGPNKGKQQINPQIHVLLNPQTQKKFLRMLKSGRRGGSKNWHQILLTKPILVQADGLVAIDSIAAEQVDNDIFNLMQDVFALGRQFEQQQISKKK